MFHTYTEKSLLPAPAFQSTHTHLHTQPFFFYHPPYSFHSHTLTHTFLPSFCSCLSTQTRGGRTVGCGFWKATYCSVRLAGDAQDSVVLHRHTHANNLMEVKTNGKFLLCTKQVMLPCGFRCCHQYTETSASQFAVGAQTIHLQCAKKKTIANSTSVHMPGRVSAS